MITEIDHQRGEGPFAHLSGPAYRWIHTKVVQNFIDASHIDGAL